MLPGQADQTRLPACLMTHLESVPAKGNIGDSNALTVGLPDLKVFEQHCGWRGLECITLKLLTHDNLHGSASSHLPCKASNLHIVDSSFGRQDCFCFMQQYNSSA